MGVPVSMAEITELTRRYLKPPTVTILASPADADRIEAALPADLADRVTLRRCALVEDGAALVMADQSPTAAIAQVLIDFGVAQ